MTILIRLVTYRTEPAAGSSDNPPVERSGIRGLPLKESLWLS
jgi:hypothetical protein